MRHLLSCQSVQLPLYHFSGLPFFWTGAGPGPAQSLRRKARNGAVKTAATSFGSRRGIRRSSTSLSLVLVAVVLFSEVGDRYATQGRTPSSVFARLAGNSQRCSTLKPFSFAPSVGNPISSYASLLAVSHGVSDNESAFPPGNAAWPA